MTTEALADLIQQELDLARAYCGPVSQVSVTLSYDRWIRVMDALRSTPEALSVDEVARVLCNYGYVNRAEPMTSVCDPECEHEGCGCELNKRAAEAICALAQAPASDLSATTEEGADGS